jgi:hypothetical protein
LSEFWMPTRIVSCDDSSSRRNWTNRILSFFFFSLLLLKSLVEWWWPVAKRKKCLERRKKEAPHWLWKMLMTPHSIEVTGYSFVSNGNIQNNTTKSRYFCWLLTKVCYVTWIVGVFITICFHRWRLDGTLNWILDR